jgi:hypothetical protein
MFWRFQLYVLPKEDIWRVSLQEDGRPAPLFMRDFDTREAAVHYAGVVAHLLDPDGETSKLWIDEPKH